MDNVKHHYQTSLTQMDQLIEYTTRAQEEKLVQELLKDKAKLLYLTEQYELCQ